MCVFPSGLFLAHSYIKYIESPFSYLCFDSARIASAVHIVPVIKAHTAYRLFEKMTYGVIVLSNRDPDAPKTPAIKQALNKSSVVCLKRLCVTAVCELCSQMCQAE